MPASIRELPAFADYDRKVLRLPPGNSTPQSPVNHADGANRPPRLAARANTVHSGPLLAQDIERAIDVAGLDRLKPGPLDLGAGKIPEARPPIHLEHAENSNCPFAAALGPISEYPSTRRFCALQIAFVELVCTVILNDVPSRTCRGHIAARFIFIGTLCPDETGDLRRLAKARKTLLYLAFRLFNRQPDVQPASSCPRGSSVIAYPLIPARIPLSISLVVRKRDSEPRRLSAPLRKAGASYQFRFRGFPPTSQSCSAKHVIIRKRGFPQLQR